MATVRPFSALRYPFEQVSDPAALLAPPYDVINAAQQQELYQRDPHNVIRLEYGVAGPEDTPENNRYTRAKATLAAWRAEGVLTLDGRPGLYPHEQRFSWAGQPRTRRGFFAAVQLQPFEAGDVLPHEWTLKGPKEDRLKLMRACQASFSPIFGLYDGRQGDVAELLARATAGSPLTSADGLGFQETLWRADDPALCAGISAALARRQILIADGHHRYETLLALRDGLRQEFPAAPDTAAFNYALMLLVDIHDPGLLVLATHRVLSLTPEMAGAFCKVVGDRFTLEKIAIAQPEQVTETLARYTDAQAFIWYANGRYTLLTGPKQFRDGLPLLDVVALQERVIAPLFALDPSGEASVERNIRYTIDPAEAVRRVDAGEAACALFLNPTPVPDVLTLAAAGVRLPQKSTYFYPKIPTGLVMYDLQPDMLVG